MFGILNIFRQWQLYILTLLYSIWRHWSTWQRIITSTSYSTFYIFIIIITLKQERSLQNQSQTQQFDFKFTANNYKIIIIWSFSNFYLNSYWNIIEIDILYQYIKIVNKTKCYWNLNWENCSGENVFNVNLKSESLKRRQFIRCEMILLHNTCNKRERGGCLIERLQHLQHLGKLSFRRMLLSAMTATIFLKAIIIKTTV